MSTFLLLGLGDHILSAEGGYTNHPSDRGGETIWGITIGTARRYGYSKPMRQMTRAEALRIYEQRYFIEPGLDAVAQVSGALAKEMFDTCVNMGPAWPGIFLQTGLNRFNRRQKDYRNIKIDGDIGPGTIAALKAYFAKRGAQAERVMLALLNGLQTGRYVEITPEDDQNEDFFFGWIANRVA